jgi:iron complex transport system substrate-binding protein
MAVFASLLAASAALRVASLNLCTDEYLLLLAEPGQVASVSRLAADPADSAIWRRARTYPSNRGDLESALPSRPTVLLTMGGSGRSTGLIAARMGLKTIDLPFPATISDVEANMDRIAAVLGTGSRARVWKARLRALARSRPAPLDAIYLGGGGFSLGTDSLGAQWMRLAGLAQRSLPGGRASLELIARRPPSVLLKSDYRRGERSLGQEWLDHPLVRNARSRTVATDGRLWTCAGPLMLGEVERLRKALP